MVDLRAKPYYLSDEDIAWVENTIASMTGKELALILVNHEKESWDEAIAVAYGKLRSGAYAAYGAEKKLDFLHNLGG